MKMGGLFNACAGPKEPKRKLIFLDTDRFFAKCFVSSPPNNNIIFMYYRSLFEVCVFVCVFVYRLQK